MSIFVQNKVAAVSRINRPRSVSFSTPEVKEGFLRGAAALQQGISNIPGSMTGTLFKKNSLISLIIFGVIKNQGPSEYINYRIICLGKHLRGLILSFNKINSLVVNNLKEYCHKAKEET